jgi:hypothetical protein
MCHDIGLALYNNHPIGTSLVCRTIHHQSINLVASLLKYIGHITLNGSQQLPPIVSMIGINGLCRVRRIYIAISKIDSFSQSFINVLFGSVLTNGNGAPVHAQSLTIVAPKHSGNRNLLVAHPVRTSMIWSYHPPHCPPFHR